ncbi:hypothetical protein BX600DRAFT_88863 [Xylariales sp. PMI_506]|nr:hypothetical protein BX600DRAFT_88863 [Xylariales sp. PMI_506]
MSANHTPRSCCVRSIFPLVPPYYSDEPVTLRCSRLTNPDISNMQAKIVSRACYCASCNCSAIFAVPDAQFIWGVFFSSFFLYYLHIIQAGCIYYHRTARGFLYFPFVVLGRVCVDLHLKWIPARTALGLAQTWVFILHGIKTTRGVWKRHFSLGTKRASLDEPTGPGNVIGELV